MRASWGGMAGAGNWRKSDNQISSEDGDREKTFQDRVPGMSQDTEVGLHTETSGDNE